MNNKKTIRYKNRENPRDRFLIPGIAGTFLIHYYEDYLVVTRIRGIFATIFHSTPRPIGRGRFLPFEGRGVQ